MIYVVQEVLETTIWHALKVNQVDLSTHTKSFCDNVLDPSRWFVPTQNLDTMWTDIGEDLAHLTCNVAMPIPCTSEKGVTLTVILDVDLA